MARMLLALSLLLFAVGAYAAGPAPAESDDAACPKEQAEQQKAPPAASATPAARPGTPAPVRARGTSASRGTPRWHSTLPGMFR